MQLSTLTRSFVLQAIEKCDKVSRPKFLEEHGFKPAREYFLLYEGRAYDSKAIVGVAYSLITGERYTAKDFSGGLALTERLERLGFEVTGKMDWKLEEQILACDLLDRNDWRTIPERDPRTEELSSSSVPNGCMRRAFPSTEVQTACTASSKT